MTEPSRPSDLDGANRWQNIMGNTHGIPNADAIPYLSEAEAQAGYSLALSEGRVRRVKFLSQRERLDMSHLDALTPLAHPDNPSISDEVPHRWFSIVVGRNPGVYCGTAHLASNISGITANVHEKFYSHQEARAHFLAALAAGQVARVTKEVIVERV
ncbi:hypothetical protein BJ912DRAFT_933965 [Pholiota molesta]|nr:hypothetical protein BJ912DRAFT_933965 [Pholiota molesta]